jgi:outer membrane murein-binding lipoprotein Lpp
LIETPAVPILPVRGENIPFHPSSHIREEVMRAIIFTVFLCGAFALAGCADTEKERQLQSDLEKTNSKRAGLQLALEDREKFVDDILKSVNEIYADLETARSKEGKLIPHAESETPWVNSPDSRARVLQNIGEIGAALSENRKKIGDLQKRIRAYGGEVEHLNALLDKLKASLQEREESIAQLKGDIQGLEQTVAEQTRLVGERERTIDEQRKQLKTVFYVAGTREELEKMGIITEEGGFLWGLLGSTTTLAGSMDLKAFTPVDRDEMQTIHVQGKVEDILPRRKPETYATAEAGPGGTEIRILEPEQFWQGRPLVVVLD